MLYLVLLHILECLAVYLNHCPSALLEEMLKEVQASNRKVAKLEKKLQEIEPSESVKERRSHHLLKFG